MAWISTLVSCHVLHRSHYFPTFSPYPKFAPPKFLSVICITGQSSTWEKNLATLSHFLVLSSPLAFSFPRHAFSFKFTFLKKNSTFIFLLPHSPFTPSAQCLRDAQLLLQNCNHPSHQNLWLSNPAVTIQSIFYWIFFLHALLAMNSLWNP